MGLSSSSLAVVGCCRLLLGHSQWMPYDTHTLPSRPAAGRIAPVFILASLMFNFVAQLTGLAHEADSGARQALAASGMLDSAYWASAALLELLLAALQASIIVFMTWALRFDLVRP